MINFIQCTNASRYRFWKKQTKEQYEDKEVPVLDEVDVSLFVYLMAQIHPNCPSMKMFQVSEL